MTAPTLRPAKQGRSRRTLERILAAARELFAEKGIAATSVQDIVTRADSSVGSFYARFGGKDDLVAHLHEVVWLEAAERWREALESHLWEALATADALEALVAIRLRLSRIDAAEREALGTAPLPDGFQDRAGEYHARVRGDLIREFEGLHRRDGGTGDERPIAEVAFALLEGALDRLGGEQGLGDEVVIRELSAVLGSYLRVDESSASPGPTAAEEETEEDTPDPPSSPENIELFDIWG